MRTAEGHRQRVKDRFRSEGLESFDEIHALELLLFYAVPQRDTKPIARALLDRFGSLPLVLEATAQELMTVPGVGENVATYLTLVLAAGRYYRVHKNDGHVILDQVEKYGRYLQDRFVGMRNETVYMLCMDAKCKLLSCNKVGEGDVNSTNIPMRRMVEMALGVNATMVVLAHNHPSGVAIPSKEDCMTTERLAKALGAMDIILLDHVVIAEDEYISMVQSRLYDPRHFSRLF